MVPENYSPVYRRSFIFFFKHTFYTVYYLSWEKKKEKMSPQRGMSSQFFAGPNAYMTLAMKSVTQINTWPHHNVSVFAARVRVKWPNANRLIKLPRTMSVLWRIDSGWLSIISTGKLPTFYLPYFIIHTYAVYPWLTSKSHKQLSSEWYTKHVQVAGLIA